MNDPMWYIETYDGNGRLTDINDVGYPTKEECEEQIRKYEEEDQEFRKSMMDRYESKLKAFVLDESTEDREPLRPIFLTYIRKPRRYLLDERGFNDVD